MIKFLLFVLFLMIVNRTLAQVFEDNSVKFGIRGGMNLSHINFSRGSQPPEIPIKTNWQPGINAGGVISIPITTDLYLRPEYLFSQIGGKIDEENRNYVINYISLPVLLNWNLFERISIFSGPQFDLLIRARDKSPNNNRSIEKQIEHRHIAISGGVNYFFTTHAAMDIRFIVGVNNVGIIRDQSNQEFKTEIVQISFIYFL